MLKGGEADRLFVTLLYSHYSIISLSSVFVYTDPNREVVQTRFDSRHRSRLIGRLKTSNVQLTDLTNRVILYLSAVGVDDDLSERNGAAKAEVFL